MCILGGQDTGVDHDRQVRSLRGQGPAHLRPAAIREKFVDHRQVRMVRMVRLPTVVHGLDGRQHVVAIRGEQAVQPLPQRGVVLGQHDGSGRPPHRPGRRS